MTERNITVITDAGGKKLVMINDIIFKGRTLFIAASGNRHDKKGSDKKCKNKINCS